MKVALYARVSTSDQRAENQLLALRGYFSTRSAWTEAVEYVDEGISGSKTSRPELDRLLADVRRGRIRAVLVYRFDRFARSTRFLAETLDEFRSRNVDFVSVSEGIDTTTPGGKLAFHVFAAVAEFERDLIRERVALGIARARSEGKRIGRPPNAFSDDEVAEAVEREGGIRAAARALETSPATVRRRLARIASP